MKKYSCSCGKSFRNGGAYKIHSRFCEQGELENPTHSYFCDDCEKGFFYEENYRKHIKNNSCYNKSNKKKLERTNKVCEYGCGQEANWKLKNGKYCCSKYHNSCSVIKKKNSKGLKEAHERGDMPVKQLDGNRGWRKGKTFIEKEVDEAKDKKCIKRGLIKKRGYKCEGCEEENHRGEKIPLEIHRIDGTKTYKESTEKNLKLLCPNCHAQTDNYRRKKSSINGEKKVSNEDLISALKNNRNIRQALLSVGLQAKGGNYKRAKKLIDKQNIEFEKKEKTINRCVNCKIEISRQGTRCKSCAAKHRNNTKIDWPKTEWLEEMVEKYSYLALSRRLGVSDNGIRKRIRNH